MPQLPKGVFIRHLNHPYFILKLSTGAIGFQSTQTKLLQLAS